MDQVKGQGSPKGQKSKPEARRFRAWRQGGLCFHCGKPLDFALPGLQDWAPSTEHLIAKGEPEPWQAVRRGYPGAFLVTVHRRCNIRRGVRAPSVQELQRLLDFWPGDGPARRAITQAIELAEGVGKEGDRMSQENDSKIIPSRGRP